jgi:hypothetical protein
MRNFRPGDPQAVHERFERVKARALKRIEHDERQLRSRLREIDNTPSRDRKPRSSRTRRAA